METNLSGGLELGDGSKKDAQNDDRLKAVIPNLGSPDVLGLKLPQILANTVRGEGFREF